MGILLHSRFEGLANTQYSNYQTAKKLNPPSVPPVHADGIALNDKAVPGFSDEIARKIPGSGEFPLEEVALAAGLDQVIAPSCRPPRDNWNPAAHGPPTQIRGVAAFADTDVSPCGWFDGGSGTERLCQKQVSCFRSNARIEGCS